jgi:NADH-quinone oxidoreductase subunit I
MRAASPNGDAAFEGRVQWSGELGYGVRAPEAGQVGDRDDEATGNISIREVDAADIPQRYGGRYR